MGYDSETAAAIRCTGGLLNRCAKDPDPKAKESYQKEFNCSNCEHHDVCVKVWKAVGYEF